MYSYFGVKNKKNDNDYKPSSSTGRVKKEKAPPKQPNAQTLYKRFRYLIYDSKDPDPSIRAREENVYRKYFVYPGTHEAIEDPGRHLVWYFYDNPLDPDSTVSDINAQYYPVTLASRTWKDPKDISKTKKADVVCVKYGQNKTILYQGSSQPPTFYIEMYNQEDAHNPIKMYGMLATSFTPPSSPLRSPRRSPLRSPRRSRFGKTLKVTPLRSLNKDLKKLMKC
jgi:hypothetical protein